MNVSNRRVFVVLALTLITLLGVKSAHAQFESASVLGTVRDTTGAAMANAKVTLENVKTGIAQTTQSDADGNYQILNVPIGTYRLGAEAAGFKRAVASEFTVTVAARQRVDLTLQVGDVAEQIVVTDAATPLETDTSSRGTVVSQTRSSTYRSTAGRMQTWRCSLPACANQAFPPAATLRST